MWIEAIYFFFRTQQPASVYSLDNHWFHGLPGVFMPDKSLLIGI